MFLKLEWYWWLMIVLVLTASIPFKIRFLNRWNGRRREQKKKQRGKWGDDR